jgi:hypothetical protein
MADLLPEPWLRDSIPAVDPLLAPLLYSFQQALEDLTKFTEGLTTEQMWLRPAGLASVGFQMRHIEGSTDRLLTYAQGQELSAEQMSALKSEMEPGATREELLERLRVRFREAEKVVRSIPVAALAERRAVGRKLLPTTLIGLIVHIAEHTQRHVGQAIVTAKLARQS